MTDVRPIPYPPDTRAKGWRFELDYERIEQSDTWGLAGAKVFDGLPLGRPLLLAMWYAAWKQTPCGSLPADDELLAAAVGIPASVFADYKAVLTRGWWMAEDGRLYHDTLVTRVLEMVGSRCKTAKRVATHREATRVQRSSNALHESDQPARHDTGTGTNLQKDKPSVEARTRATRKCPDDFKVTDDMSEWAEREAPHVAVVRETEKFRDHTFKTAIKDWPGAWRNWIRRAAETPAHRSGAPPSETPYARQMRERAQVLAPGVAAKAPGQPTHLTVIEADGTDQQKRLA